MLIVFVSEWLVYSTMVLKQSPRLLSECTISGSVFISR